MISEVYRLMFRRGDFVMMNQTHRNTPIVSNNGSNSKTTSCEVSNISHKSSLEDNNNTTAQEQPCKHERVKLIYIDN
jgi:hypothetical protein